MAESPSQNGRSVTRQEFELEVVERARHDRAFREQLLADPKGALEAAFGVELPPGIELNVLEESTTRFYLVLPVNVEELSDDQLAAAAGGTGDPSTAAALWGGRGLLWKASAVRMR